MVEIAWLAPAFLIGIFLVADGAISLPTFDWRWPIFVTALGELIGGAAIIVRWTRAWGAFLLVLTMLFATVAETAVLGMVSPRPSLFLALACAALAWHWSGRLGPRSILVAVAGFVTGLALMYAVATVILLGSSVQTLG